MPKFKTYAIAILIPLLVGGIVGFIMSGSMDYDELVKPPLAPPGIVFPIVWSILYVLMGVSYARLKLQGKVDKNIRLIYYGQLVVNALWSIIFFNLKLRFVAFLWILLLLALVITMIIKFYNKDKLAGLLQIPYLVWTTFATYLNLFFYILNR
ncbi:MAG: tryptophan-rich sensory protein [Clostridia bacterium]|nr:tryptophan-rich sensory protein [Clostridia bacterium]